MFNKTRIVKRFVRRNKTKFFIGTTIVASYAAWNQKNAAESRQTFIGEKGLMAEYEHSLQS